MNPQDAFVTRLRRYRERYQISLDDMATMTRIKRELLVAFERNDLSEWPRGLYARAWVRAYADVVGLNPADTVDEFCRLFPQGDRRVAGTMQEMAAIVAHASEYTDEFGHAEDRRSPHVDPMPEQPWYAAMGQWTQTLWWRIVPALRPTPGLKRSPRVSP
ncbi:MAG: helix-turn-helix domain-containing protein [Vicinamibacterales bacterium]